jgi:predicted regulator of Ras-like GTPase activity (Roadblock/LC7/MglB family)
MLNFFKNLFGTGATEVHANGNGYAAAAPAAPVHTPSRPAATGQVGQPPAPRTAAPIPRSPRPPSDGNSVQIPLYTIIAVLPLELKTRVRESAAANVHVTLPLDQVLMQLGTGAVKISFGELRALAPNAFTSQTNFDQNEILLPLNEILPQINPALLARRQSQRHVEVPDEVQGPFGNESAEVRFGETRTGTTASATTTNPSLPPISRETKMPPPPAPIAPPAPVKMPAAPMAQPIQSAQPFQQFHQAKPVQPAAPVKPTMPNPPARPVPPPPAPPAPAPALESSPLIPFRSSIASTPTPRPPTATPPASPPVRPVFPSARGAGATPVPASVPRLPSAAPAGNGRAAVPHPPQATPPAPEVFLSAPLANLSESWPEVLRSEIEQLNLSHAHLALPVRVVEPALKQGKVAFPWKVLRSWIRPATLPTVSAHDGMMLELPLRVIAPLFIARQKQGATQQKLQINESIPNLFFGFPQAESAAPAVEPPPAPPTPPPTLAAELAATEDSDAMFSPAPKHNGVQDTNFYVWGETGEVPQVDETEFKRKPSAGPGTDFLSRYATPNEVVSRAASLEGVVGALVALPDGLMVASKLSPDLNGDTLAAFLPHIFGKVSQCTKELRMGELNNLHFTVGNVPWKIFRVNAIFFAAFGNAGQPLPTGQLAALAAQLDRKK